MTLNKAPWNLIMLGKFLPTDYAQLFATKNLFVIVTNMFISMWKLLSVIYVSVLNKEWTLRKQHAISMPENNASSRTEIQLKMQLSEQVES